MKNINCELINTNVLTTYHKVITHPNGFIFKYQLQQLNQEEQQFVLSSIKYLKSEDNYLFFIDPNNLDALSQIPFNDSRKISKLVTPVKDLFKHHSLLVIVAALVFAGNSAIGYMTTGGFIQNYTTASDGAIHLPRTAILMSVALASAFWLLFTWISGCLSDKIGRRNTYILGWFIQLVGVLVLFPLVNLATIWSVTLALCILSVGIGMTYGAQSAFYSEIFPASIRFSGVSIAYAMGAIIGGAFSPLIATWLISQTHNTNMVTFYLAVMTIIGLLATLALRDRTGIPLGPDHEDEQKDRPFSWQNKIKTTRVC